MAALLMSAPPERHGQLVEAIWDRACGQTLFLEGNKKPGGKSPGTVEQGAVLVLADGSEVKGTVYTIPGDPAAQKRLVEHGCGRPAVRTQEKVDTVIQLIHRVPGKANPAQVVGETEDDSEPAKIARMEADEANLAMWRGDLPDPGDDPGEDE